MCQGIVRSGQDVSHRRAEDLGLPGGKQMSIVVNSQTWAVFQLNVF